MKLYVMTRGTVKDYAFVGAIPPELWWDAHSDTGLLFTTEPAVAVRGTADGWSAVLFGVPSARTDHDGRRVRYTLIAESGAEDALLAAQLVRVALDPDARGELGGQLDGIYSTERLNAHFGGRSAFTAPELEEAAAVLRAVASDQPADIPSKSHVKLPWAGPYDLPAARDAFVAHAHALALGNEGLCLVAAGAASLEDTDRARQLAGPQTALLLPNASLAKVVELPKKGATPTGPEVWARKALGRTGGTERWRPSRRWVAVVLTGALVLVILWVLRKL